MPDASNEVVLRYKGPIDFKAERQSDGTYSIRGVPIFATHQSAKGDDQHLDKVDARWMYACIKDQEQLKRDGYLPKVCIGHTSDSENAPEQPVFCRMDNYRFSEADGWLYADYVDIQEADLPLLKRFPGRSAEPSIKQPAIRTVALLGATPPYFKFPDLVKFKERDRVVRYAVEIPPMAVEQQEQPADQLEQTKKKESFSSGSGQAAQSPEEKADYEKFVKYMQMYEASKGEPAQGSEDDPADKPGKGKPTNEPPKKDDDMPTDDKKKPEFSDAESTAKYTELSVKYETILGRVDTLTKENVTLLDARERDFWGAKYAEARIPEGRAKPDAVVDMIMDMPKEKRATYFDTAIGLIKGPTQTKLKTDDQIHDKPSPGSEAEAEAMQRYWEEGKAKGTFKNYGEAQLRYIKTNR